MEEREPLTIRETAKGIAVRAGVLGVAGLIVFGFVFSAAAKMASGIVKVLISLALMVIGGGVVTFKLKQAQRRLRERRLERDSLTAERSLTSPSPER